MRYRSLVGGMSRLTFALGVGKIEWTHTVVAQAVVVANTHGNTQTMSYDE